MYRTITLFLLSLFSSVGISLVHSPSLAASRSHTVTVQSISPVLQKPLPAWKAKVANGVARLAVRLEKVFPDRRAAATDDINGLAIASLCCGIGGLTIVPILGAIAAIILGVMALNKIRETGQSGRGLAIAGIIMGGVGLLIYGLYFALIIATL